VLKTNTSLIQIQNLIYERLWNRYNRSYLEQELLNMGCCRRHRALPTFSEDYEKNFGIWMISDDKLGALRKS
jgi:hypothetical protein